jgi:hypothetical protein
MRAMDHECFLDVTGVLSVQIAFIRSHEGLLESYNFFTIAIISAAIFVSFRGFHSDAHNEYKCEVERSLRHHLIHSAAD